MLGYHVHEKAILVVILSLALDLAKSQTSACIYQRLGIVGHYSLLPLVFDRKEYVLKVGCAISCLRKQVPVTYQIQILLTALAALQPEDAHGESDRLTCKANPVHIIMLHGLTFLSSGTVGIRLSVL